MLDGSSVGSLVGGTLVGVGDVTNGGIDHLVSMIYIKRTS